MPICILAIVFELQLTNYNSFSIIFKCRSNTYTVTTNTAVNHLQAAGIQYFLIPHPYKIRIPKWHTIAVSSVRTFKVQTPYKKTYK